LQDLNVLLVMAAPIEWLQPQHLDLNIETETAEMDEDERLESVSEENKK